MNNDPQPTRSVLEYDEDLYHRLSPDLTVRYRRSGRGDVAVIFIPGWTMSCEVFSHQLRHFAHSERYFAVSYDPRSQGLSTRTGEGHHYEQHARDLRAFIEHLGTRAILVGWSAGCITLFEYLRLFGQDQLDGVVVLDMPPRIRGYDRRTEWVDFGTCENGDQDGVLKGFCYDLHFDRDAFNQEFATWMLEDPSLGAVQFFSDMSSLTPNLVASQLIMSMQFVDNTDVAEAIDATLPVMYFVRDEWHDLAGAWVREHAPHADFESHGKHLMFWENPDRFNEALDRFLSKINS